MADHADKSPLAIPNIRFFIYFRVFFNARFYYPVFTILFLDFGLTLQQFALLNAVWAASIVLLEVPSGALADIVGRRNLLVFAGVLMVAEMALLCLVPLGRPKLLFMIFLLNRILSGAAEASASGADEALAYDSLKEEGNTQDWGRVLEIQMRRQSIAYIGAMSLGAAVYDPALMQRFADWVGFHVTLSQNITLRFPLYLTLGMAVLTLLTTLRMKEAVMKPDGECIQIKDCGRSIADAFRVTLRAGGWILRTPFPLVIIAAGLLFDSTIRMIITLNSQYYRLIELPEASFGLIGSGLAVLGIFIPRVARTLVRNYSPTFNLAVMAVTSVVGLAGMTFFIPVLGIFPVALLFSVMYLLNFFLSHYLNRITESGQRATVLSFKGLSLNLAYGLIGLLYSLLLALLRRRIEVSPNDLGAQGVENTVFIQSIAWFPWFFLLALAVLVVFARLRLRHSDEHKRRG
ncbi:MAG: MFS transporter [Desulfatiglandaceae bacterium]